MHGNHLKRGDPAQGAASSGHAPERAVLWVLLIEGAVNTLVLVMKLVAGLSTGSLAILGDAIHSLTDVVNNIVAAFVIRLSAKPADHDHPYGHRKFETLAVFGLAALLTVLAVELILHALRRDAVEVTAAPWELMLMSGVLLLNVALALWERWWARRLSSSILMADASHTLADVLTTVAVIAGWQFAAAGYAWLDTVTALGVAGLVLYLAFGLFSSAVPVLVDAASIEPQEVKESVRKIPGVHSVRRLRSRWIGSAPAVDMVVEVDAELTTAQAHDIADAVETVLAEQFGVDDVSIHVEPAA